MLCSVSLVAFEQCGMYFTAGEEARIKKNPQFLSSWHKVEFEFESSQIFHTNQGRKLASFFSIIYLEKIGLKQTIIHQISPLLCGKIEQNLFSLRIPLSAISCCWAWESDYSYFCKIFYACFYFFNSVRIAFSSQKNRKLGKLMIGIFLYRFLYQSIQWLASHFLFPKKLELFFFKDEHI